jgi:hypothetical protein
MMRRRLLVPLPLLLTAVGCGVTSGDDAAHAPAIQARAPDTEDTGMLPFKTRDGSARQLPVTVSGGRAWIGDMGFGRMDDLRPRSHSVSDLDRRWPDARVPYCFYDGPDAAIRLGQQTREAFREAAAYYEARVPSLRFVERACPSAVDALSAAPRFLYPSFGDAVLVVMKYEKDAGLAELGWEDTSRGMWLSPKIGEIDPDTGRRKGVGTVVHELGHTLGLAHEHQRADRNDYVNVCASHDGDYEILDPSDHQTLAPYDYFSRMHYDLTRTSLPLPLPSSCEGYEMYPRHDTLPEVPGGQDIMGSPDLTGHDINSLMLMYGPGLGTPESDDQFGAAMAVGDFDLDGYDDLIVAAPREVVGDSGVASGAAYAFKGTYRQPAPWRLVRESEVAEEEADDRFGAAFAVGDFVRQDSCDSRDPDACELPFPDLAVGVPGKRGGVGTARLGAVMMFLGGRWKGATYRRDPAREKGCADFAECRGTTSGPLTPWHVVLRAADARGVTGGHGDLFGASLAAGDFDGDGEMDLAVGAPGADGVGRVFIYRGSDLKTGSHASRVLYPIGAANVPGARFGWSLAAGDFDLDGRDDLAVGAPGAGSGNVIIFKGRSAQPILAEPRPLPLPPTPLNSAADFGFSLAAKNLLNTSRASLIVGAPKQTGQSNTTSGAIHLYSWGPSFGTVPVPDGLGHRQTILSSGGRTDRFGHSVAIYNGLGTTFNDVAVGAPGRNGGKGGLSVYDATSATNLALLTHIAPTNLDVSYGAALATGDVRVSMPLAGLPELPNARLFVGAPLSLNGAMLAGRVAGLGFFDASSPFQSYSFTQAVRSTYTRAD